MRRFIGVAFAAASLAGAASAQDWQPVDPATGETGAVACAPSGVGDLCLSISCRPGEVLSAGLVLRGGSLPMRLRAVVRVDGRRVGSLNFTSEQGFLRASLDEEDRLLNRLREGSQASISLGRRAGNLEVPIGLGGSQDAIGAAVAACATMGTKPAPVGDAADAPLVAMTEEPTDEPVMVMTEEPVEVPLDEPVAETLAEEPSDEPVAELAEPSEEPADLTSDASLEEPAELPAEEPVAELSDAPAEELAEEPVAALSEEPASLLAEEPGKQLPVKTSHSPAGEPADATLESLADLPADLLAEPPALEPSDNPAGDAIADNEAFCAGGTTSVEPGFMRQADVDGDGLNDLLLDYAGLTCDGARAFCGSGGCTQEVWLADRSEPYRPLVSALLEEIVLPAPGEILFRLDGAECGLAGAEACERTYAVQDGALVPKE